MKKKTHTHTHKYILKHSFGCCDNRVIHTHREWAYSSCRTILSHSLPLGQVQLRTKHNHQPNHIASSNNEWMSLFFGPTWNRPKISTPKTNERRGSKNMRKNKWKVPWKSKAFKEPLRQRWRLRQVWPADVPFVRILGHATADRAHEFFAFIVFCLFIFQLKAYARCYLKKKKKNEIHATHIIVYNSVFYWYECWTLKRARTK